MKEQVIKKGSKVYVDGKCIAVTTMDLKPDDVPTQEYFDPEIPNGTEFKDIKFYYEDRLIYHDPYWT